MARQLRREDSGAIHRMMERRDHRPLERIPRRRGAGGDDRSAWSEEDAFPGRFTSLAPGLFLSGLQPFQYEPPHVGCYGSKGFSIFAFTAVSILIGGGRGRLKPSPGSFFLAPLPSLPLTVCFGGSLVFSSAIEFGP